MTRTHDPAVPAKPTIVDGEFVPTHEVPFSEALDKLIAEIRARRAPNLGRFCGHCQTPLRETTASCPTCGTTTSAVPPREKISRRLANVYTAKRRREGRIVQAAAWLGLLLGAGIAVGLIVILPGWTKAFAVVFMILGSYFIATYLGNVVVQNHAYRSGLTLFARGWDEYLQGRDGDGDED